MTFVIAVEDGLLPLVQAGGTIGWILLGLSVVALTLVFLHLWTIRRGRLLPADHLEHLARCLQAGRVDDVLAWAREPGNVSLPARIAVTAITRARMSPLGPLEVPDAAEEAGQAEVARLERSLEGLSVIAAIAPLLGLLGTVLGMVEAFDAIAEAGPQAAGELASSISMALVTTLLGLVVAIPCVAMHAWFRVRLESIAADAAVAMEAVLAPLMEANEG